MAKTPALTCMAKLQPLWQRLQCFRRNSSTYGQLPGASTIGNQLLDGHHSGTYGKDCKDSSTYSNNFSTYGKTPALVARSLDSILHAHYPWLLLLCLALLVYMVYPLDGSYGTPRSSWTGDSYPAEKAMMILKWDTLTITQCKTKLNEQQQWLRKRNPQYALP